MRFQRQSNPQSRLSVDLALSTDDGSGRRNCAICTDLRPAGCTIHRASPTLHENRCDWGARMRRISIRRATSFLTALGIFVFSVSTSSQSRRISNLEVEDIDNRPAVAREVLVKLRERSSCITAAELLLASTPKAWRRWADRASSAFARARFRASALIAALSNRADVEYAEPNYVVHAFADPSDPYFPQLWGLKNIGQPVNGGAAGTAGADIHAAEAWDLTVGSASNVVAVIDTGIDYTHNDLAPNMWSAPAPFTVTIGACRSPATPARTGSTPLPEPAIRWTTTTTGRTSPAPSARPATTASAWPA